jgi:predicted nucleic acid-binding protein
VPLDRQIVLSVGLTEVISILVRKNNAGAIGTPRFQLALRSFKAEFNLASPVRVIHVSWALAESAYRFVETYSLNSTDAIILRSALDAAALLRPAGDILLLVSSDRRLIQAARREGLTAFNPEVESIPALDAILGP